MSNTELKPCRDCGDYAIRRRRVDRKGRWYAYVCENCGYCTPWFRWTNSKFDWSTFTEHMCTMWNDMQKEEGVAWEAQKRVNAIAQDGIGLAKMDR